MILTCKNLFSQAKGEVIEKSPRLIFIARFFDITSILIKLEAK